jgi:hypothetical protein
MVKVMVVDEESVGSALAVALRADGKFILNTVTCVPSVSVMKRVLISGRPAVVVVVVGKREPGEGEDANEVAEENEATRVGIEQKTARLTKSAGWGSEVVAVHRGCDISKAVERIVELASGGAPASSM